MHGRIGTTPNNEKNDKPERKAAMTQHARSKRETATHHLWTSLGKLLSSAADTRRRGVKIVEKLGQRVTVGP
jgi:hypothetical protein